MAKKPIKCCSKTPAYLVTYSVSGSEKDYLVCLSCNKIECFSKYIIERLSVENKIKNFQIEPSELIDELTDISELYVEQTTQNEPGAEPGGAVTK